MTFTGVGNTSACRLLKELETLVRSKLPMRNMMAFRFLTSLTVSCNMRTLVVLMKYPDYDEMEVEQCELDVSKDAQFLKDMSALACRWTGNRDPATATIVHVRWELSTDSLVEVNVTYYATDPEA